MKERVAHGMFIAAALAASTGCVSWQSGDVRTLPDPLFGPDHRAPGARKPLPVVLSVSFDAIGVDLDSKARSKSVDRILSMAHEVFDQGDQFVLRDGREGQDYALAVDVTDDASPNIALAVLSGLTLTMLPAVASDDFTITASLQSPDGKDLGRRRIRQKMTTLIQFFTIFGMPFAAPSSVEKELWIGVFRDVALWTRDAIAQKAAAPAAAPIAQASLGR